MLLEYLGEHKAAKSVENAVVGALASTSNHPQDLGGKATTEQVTQAVIAHVKQNLSS
jgi:tartrate dehydrogenase/decarboxylase/D-malate dehydrogenase